MLVLLLSLNIFEKKIADWGKLVGNSFLQQIHTVDKINLKKNHFYSWLWKKYNICKKNKKNLKVCWFVLLANNSMTFVTGKCAVKGLTVKEW